MNGKTIVLRNDLIVDVDLTLLNGAIRVDQDKKIKVISGTGNVPTTLTFNNEKISNACDKMWSEIESNDPLCLLKVLNGTSISQAKSAINFSNGAALYIDASTLTNNYRNIVLSSFYGLYPFNLTDSKISGSYYGMLPPHSTDFLPYSGVEINNVNEVTVGNSLLPSYLNEFKKLRYGIVANASNVNVYNNKFNEIKVNTPFFNLINNSISIAIWTRDGFSTSTSQFINVGNTGVNQKNYFTDCWKGVQVEGSMSTLIKGNEFKNMTITNVYTRNTIGKSINVQNNTMSGKFGIGVLCVNFIKSLINVTDNLIDESNAYNHPTTYLNTGIWLANVIPTPSSYNITNNQIYRCENGIIGDGVPTAVIKNNSVIYQRNNIQMLNTGRMHRGIQLKNSERAEITLNTISRTNPNAANNGTLATTAILRGISVELSEESYVHDNNIKQMGYGMYWRGSSINSTISCNIMEKCYNGVFFDFAEIGHQGNATNPSGNYWVSNQDPVGDMDGTMNTNFLPTTNWYADITPPNNLPSNPNPSNVPTGQLAILSASGNSNCQIAPGGTTPGPIGPGKREALFGSIIRDEKQFNGFEDETRQLNRRYVYHALKNNPSWINLGGNDDVDYQTFFTDFSLENDGMMEDINDFISDTNYSAAATLNNTISPNLVPEFNHKTVTEIYLATWANDVEIDTNQFMILESIACQNPLEGGPAVYGARILIGLDYECSNGANRSSFESPDPVDQIVEESDLFTLFPNPSNGMFTLVNNSAELTDGIVQIYDVTGKMVGSITLTGDSETMIDLLRLPNGMYHYLIYSVETLVFTDKFVISK